ncbi:MAG: hypothetical protein RIB80_03330 [Rhodospirillales bacterium]
MFKFLIPATAALVLLAAPAHAGNCPNLWKAFDEAVGSSTAPKKDIAKAQGLRAKGEAMHKAGKHGESVKALEEAMKLIGK